MGEGAKNLERTIKKTPNIHTFDELPKFEDDQDNEKYNTH